MTGSARKRAALATLTANPLSALRQEAVKAYKRARKKFRYSFRKSLANPDSVVLSALTRDACISADEAMLDAASAMALESSHYLKPAKKRRFLS